MKKYPDKAILFDLFGTLCGATSPEWMSIYKFNKNQKVHPKVQRAVCGSKFTNWEEYLDGFCEALEIENNTENKKTLMEVIYGELEKAEENIPEGRKETLEYLSNQGYKLAIVSNSYPPTKEILIEGRGGLSSFFKDPYIVLSYETGMTKQNSGIYLEALKRLKVNAENAVMIGDSLSSDIIKSKIATKNKIGGIFIYNKSEIDDIDKPKSIRTQGYDFYIVSSLKEIPEVVEDFFGKKA